MMDEPRFAQPIPNVTVAVGRDANLPCVVEHLGAYKVSRSKLYFLHFADRFVWHLQNMMIKKSVAICDDKNDSENLLKLSNGMSETERQIKIAKQKRNKNIKSSCLRCGAAALEAACSSPLPLSFHLGRSLLRFKLLLLLLYSRALEFNYKMKILLIIKLLKLKLIVLCAADCWPHFSAL